MRIVFRQRTALVKTIMAIAGILFGLQCAPPLGGGSEAGNARVTGKVVDTLGSPVGNVKVFLRSANFDPVKDTLVSNAGVTTTGSDGVYRISVQKGIDYAIEAQLPSRYARAFITTVTVRDIETTAPPCTLKSPGAIKVRIPEGVDRALGYVFIPGTSHFAFLKNAPEFVVLDSVPACVIPEISYSSSAIPDISVIRYNIPIDPGDTTVVNEPFWKYSCQVVLNTSSTGAAISGDVMDFPVCIRLTSANFVFSQASPEGADIRFAKHDNTSLPYEIERWDAANEQAELWVKVDTVRGNNASQAIVMYWGNPAVSGKSNGAAVFDTAKGFQGIWHLGGADSISPDATGNRYNGNASFTASVPGMIGNALHFNGRSSCIRMRGTAPQSRLNFPMSGNYMISAWIYHDTLADSVTYLIAGKGERQYFMKTFGLAQSTAQHAHQWEFTEYHGNNIWQAATQVPAAAKAWTHLVGIRDGSNQYLYVNGALAMAGYRVFGTGQDTVQRDTTDDFAIGAFLRPVADWGQGYAYFKGTIDEVEVLSVPRSVDWIKLSYMNQKESDALVQFK